MPQVNGKKAPIWSISHPARSYFEEGHQYARCAASEPPILRSWHCYWLLLVASKTGEIRLEWKPLVSSHSISTESVFFYKESTKSLTCPRNYGMDPVGLCMFSKLLVPLLPANGQNRCTHREMGIQYL